MYKYIFNTKGKYVAYIYNDMYCFSKDNDYIGFFRGIDLYDYSGKYIGTLTSDDRIIKQKNINRNNIIPIIKPYKPYKPYNPYNRYSMSRLPYNYEDVFINDMLTTNFEELDSKYSKFLDCKIFSNDGKFLGKINFNKYDQESIANQYGDYGSQYSAESLFNKYGDYGSQYSSDSPFNEYTITPPVILDMENKVIAKLTINKYLTGLIEIVDAVEFFNWFNSKLER